MILVDTSVWIEVFQAKRPLDLEAIVDFDDVGTCLPVIQEVLQGFRDEAAYRRARQAVDLFRSARRGGRTVRSSVDCLIAACAIRHDLEVLHRDRDYTVLAEVSALRQRSL